MKKCGPNHHLTCGKTQWYLRYKRHGCETHMPLGTKSAKEARKLRDEIMGLRKQPSKRFVFTNSESIERPRPRPTRLPTESECARILQRLERAKRERRAGESSYMLGPCVVLAAAVFGTKRAYEWAMEQLPLARFADGRAA